MYPNEITACLLWMDKSRSVNFSLADPNYTNIARKLADHLIFCCLLLWLSSIFCFFLCQLYVMVRVHINNIIDTNSPPLGVVRSHSPSTDQVALLLLCLLHLGQNLYLDIITLADENPISCVLMYFPLLLYFTWRTHLIWIYLLLELNLLLLLKPNTATRRWSRSTRKTRTQPTMLLPTYLYLLYLLLYSCAWMKQTTTTIYYWDVPLYRPQSVVAVVVKILFSMKQRTPCFLPTYEL